MRTNRSELPEVTSEVATGWVPGWRIRIYMSPTVLRSLTVLFLLSGLSLLAACDRHDNPGMGRAFDSTEATIEQKANAIGAKLDTAATGVKTAMKEMSIQNIFDQLNGMEYVEAELETNGDLTLVGRVPNVERKEFAEQIVRNIRGIRTVTNALRVESVVDSGRDTVK